MHYDTKIREEELKHKVAADWFAAYDCTRVIGNIDFAVDIPATELALGYAAEPALWAEAKAGVKKDIAESFVQLILTIGRARRADELPPARRQSERLVLRHPRALPGTKAERHDERHERR